MISEVIQLRRDLHRFPELSGQELETTTTIKDFLQKHGDLEIVEQIGGHGFAAIFNYGSGGKTVALRCELDALPILEANTLEYKSENKGVSHKCGHDGHMAIVAGMVFWLEQQDFPSGRVILLFQAAEETGKGAHSMLKDKRFKELEIDYIFALHNIPGFPLGQVIRLDDIFSAEVQSFKLTFKGLESHAAQPENGRNPTQAFAEFIHELAGLEVSNPLDEKFAILSPVYTNIGQLSYGTSAGYGEIHYTVRSWSSAEMDLLVGKIQGLAIRLANKYQLSFDLTWFEHFPASTNDLDCNVIVEKAASSLGLSHQLKEYPFRFGEDFGWFSKDHKTSMFGFGAGIEVPALHNPWYDFPDDLIEKGMSIFGEIIRIVFEADH